MKKALISLMAAAMFVGSCTPTFADEIKHESESKSADIPIKYTVSETYKVVVPTGIELKKSDDGNALESKSTVQFTNSKNDFFIKNGYEVKIKLDSIELKPGEWSENTFTPEDGENSVTVQVKVGQDITSFDDEGTVVATGGAILATGKDDIGEHDHKTNLALKSTEADVNKEYSGKLVVSVAVEKDATTQS